MPADGPLVARTLYGGEHPTLGEVAVHCLGDTTAIGLSAGVLPKAYWHLDPNEDAAMAAVGRDGALLAVADGHNGFDVAQCATASLHDQAEALLSAPADHTEEALSQALVRVEEEAKALLAQRRPPRSLSRAALSVALVGPGRLFTATYGDTAVVRVREGRAKPLAAGETFLGARRCLPAHATARLRPGDVVVVCSDGVTDFIGEDWPERIAESAVSETSAEGVVRDLLRRAFDGGAGDHLAVAVTTVV